LAFPRKKREDGEIQKACQIHYLGRRVRRKRSGEKKEC